MRAMTGVSASACLLGLTCILFCWVTCSASSLRIDDADRKPWMDELENNVQNDLYVSELANRLRALTAAEMAGLAQKRGFDFGLGRGFSASQAAKHKMGLEAAAYPGGPGRRRRSVEEALRQ